MDLNLSDFAEAKERISCIAYHTLLRRSRTFSSIADADVYLKYENLQRTGSFKIRGSSNKISKIVAEGRSPVIVASSSGNHAQGVACSSTMFGLRSIVVMPEAAPLTKIDATEGYGAKVVLHGSCYDEAYQKARDICDQEGGEFVHPYDDLDVIAGQGTIGLEIMDDLPDADVVLVPAGGGGLVSGIACAIKHKNPQVKVYGVQSEKADAIAQSYGKDTKVITKEADTIADGIAVNCPGDITMELINRYVDGILIVSEESIAEAVMILMERCKQVVEPAGATSVAALLSGMIDAKGKKVVCVLSGGNIDVKTIGKLINKGMAKRGRTVELFAIVKSKQKALMQLLEDINAEGVTIIDTHVETSTMVTQPNEVLLRVRCETTGQEHKDRMLRHLKEKGHRFATAGSLEELVIENWIQSGD